MSGSGDKLEDGKSVHATVMESKLGHVVKQAELGFKTGGDQYDTYRPGYTDECVKLIASEIMSGTQAKSAAQYQVLELGAGTGKLTELLRKELPKDVKYLATEPSDNFLDVLKAKGLNIDTALAPADKIPLADGSVSNVVCAQCFHWFAEKSDLESIRRVMVPGGKLILVWNSKKFHEGWLRQFYEQREEVVARVDGSMKYLINTGEWRREIDYSPLFKLQSHRSLGGIDYRGDMEKIVSNFVTVSAYNQLPADVKEEYKEKQREILRNWPGLDLNDIQMPFTTVLYVYEAQ